MNLDDLPNFGDKICTCCLISKDKHTSFIVYKETSGTYYSKKCRQCIGKIQRQNPKNKIYMKKYHADYQERKRTHESLRHKEYYNKHKEQIAKRIKDRAKTPEGKLAIKRMNHKRRLRLLNIEGSFTIEELRLVKDYARNCCEYCGITISEKYHVDHIQPISKGGDGWITNIAVTCVFCNSSKNDKTVKEFEPLLIPYFAKRNLELFNK